MNATTTKSLFRIFACWIALATSASAQTQWREIGGPAPGREWTGLHHDGSQFVLIAHGHQGGCVDTSTLYHSPDGENWSAIPVQDGRDVSKRLQEEIDLQGAPFSLQVLGRNLGVSDEWDCTLSLKVRYTTTTGLHEARVPEGDTLQIPDPAHTLLDAGRTSPSIRIVAAYYGGRGLLGPSRGFARHGSAMVLAGQSEDPYPMVAFSTDEGLSWQKAELSNHWEFYRQESIAVASGNGRCVVLARDGDSYREPSALFLSSDLVEWSEVQIPFSIAYDIEFVLTTVRFAAGRFLVCGSVVVNRYDRTGVMLSSSDGVNWGLDSFPETEAIKDAHFDGSSWCAVGEAGEVYASPDGRSWILQAARVERDPETIVSGNGSWLVATERGRIYSSRDLASWVLQAENAGSLLAGGRARFLATRVSKHGSRSSSPLQISPHSPDGIADITGQPQSAYVVPRESVTLSVTAVGDGPISYQWFEGSSGDESSPLLGAHDATYQTPPLQTTTRYWVKVDNALGKEGSRSALLTVQTQPQVTGQPKSASLNMGNYQSLSVSATGANLSYQWYRGPSGDTSDLLSAYSSFRVPTNEPGLVHYWVRVSNEIGFADSATVTVEVRPVLPVITLQPIDLTLPVRDFERLRFEAEGPSLRYQWYLGETGDRTHPLQGEDSRYFYPDTDGAGVFRYWVEVSNAAGSVSSEAATVTVITSAPVITSEPADLVLAAGADGSLSMNAEAFLKLGYQWYRGESGDTSNPLANEQFPSFRPPTERAGVFSYWVRASNSDGHADSRTATVRVLPTLYAEWLKGNGLPTDASGEGSPLASPAGDGVSNLFKYAFGASPFENTAAHSRITTWIDPQTNETYLALRFRLLPTTTDLIVTVEESHDLEHWIATAVDTGSSIDQGSGGVTHLIRASVPVSVEARRFLRLRIEMNPSTRSR